MPVLIQGLELLLLRLVLWLGLPILLVVLAVGPRRSAGIVSRGWHRLFDRRHDPAEVLGRVVEQHRRHVAELHTVVTQAEAAKAEIERNQHASETNLDQHERDAEAAVGRGDDLAARAALYRANLERLAVQNFGEELARQVARIDEARKRLYRIELQLRQYEVGRSVLLSQLAEAKTVEQQYALANEFDPFSAIAAWQRTEGQVRAVTHQARAAERVLHDTAPAAAPITASLLDAQLAELKTKLAARNGRANPNPGVPS